MIKRIKYLIIFTLFINYSNAGTGLHTCSLNGLPNTYAFLKEVAGNINWMVKCGIIFAVGMMIIQLLFNHNENLLQAASKLVGGLVVLKVVASLISTLIAC